ncbi:type 2 periplasmic-binding domain-containing protein, partial [Escherichia coli]
LELVKHGQADVHAGLIQSPERDLFLDFGPEIMAIETHVFLDQHLLGTDFDKIFSGEIDIKVGVVLGGYEAYYAAQYLPKL